jgi:hypothetical protein
MNKACIKSIFNDFLDSYEEGSHQIFIESQAAKHSCDLDDVENLIEIYGSYHFSRHMSDSLGMTTTYDEFMTTCFDILDEIIASKAKKWWEFWR